MREARCFVQFIHPGSEHGSDRGTDIRSWNQGPHRRKFLKVLGRTLINGTEDDAEIVFWGEWEPASRIDRDSPDLPTIVLGIFTSRFRSPCPTG